MKGQQHHSLFLLAQTRGGIPFTYQFHKEQIYEN
jgi:hypothetical protein